jgi:hypothetical protein
MKVFLADLDSKKTELEQLIDAFRSKVAGVEDIIDAVLSDAQVRDIAKDILAIKDDTCALRTAKYLRADKLASVKRFTEAMSTEDRVDDTDPATGAAKTPTLYVPPLTKGQMVFVNFAGIGSELDRGHFAIVWDDVSPRQDSIVIIPTKSEKPHYKEYDHAFSIGQVDFFSKETWVQLRAITTISRKRITLTRFQPDSSTPNREVYISDDQEKWIEDAMRVTFGKQMSLLDKILNNGKSRIPEFLDYAVQSLHFNRATRFFKNDWDSGVTYYCLYDDENQYEIHWHAPQENLSRGARNTKILDWAHAMPSSGLSRQAVKQAKYQNLQALR